MEKKLGKDTTQDEIKAELEEGCESFPVIVRKACESIVDKHASELINGLIKREPPATICKQVKLC